MYVVIETENTVKIFSGKEYPVVITRYIGRATYERNGETVEADELHTFDYGPKLGVTKVYKFYPQDETPEHREKCLNQLMAAACQAVRNTAGNS